MNARDQLLEYINDGVLNAKEIIQDILVNYLDIDSANDYAESYLNDNGFDGPDLYDYEDASNFET